jgi:ABC-type transport system substrate-binding protein/class 3 adenylate cyclase
VPEPREPSSGEPASSPDAAASAAAPETELRTFLIADIRGYTTYTREHGDEAGAALASRFGELVAEVVTSRGGRLLELRGDEALVVFVSARKALRAAVDLQARFVAGELPRGVGIGLDAGEAVPVGEGYRGASLNLAARLCGQAAAGEILASEAVIHLAAKLDGIAYVDAHAVKLKGYQESVRVVVVMPSDRAKGHRIASGDGGRGPVHMRYAVTGVVVLVVAVIAAVLAGGPFGTGSAADPSPSTSSEPDPLAGAELPLLAFFDAATGELRATTPFASPRNIAFFSDGAFWIIGENPRTFNRIDPIDHRVKQSIPIPVVEVSGFNYDDASFWVTDLAAPRVVRIDKRTGVPSEFFFGVDEDDQDVAHDVAVGAGSVWLARPDVPEVVRLDAETGEVQARLDITAWGVSFGGGGLWYWREGWLGHVDAVTNQETFPPVQLSSDTWLGNIYVGGGDAWTALSSVGQVWRVSRSGHQTNYSLQPGVGEMIATERTMWVTNEHTGVLTGIDLVTGQQTHQIDTGHATLAVAASGEELMVAVGPTVDEAIAELEGTVLTLATDGTPWWDPAPDPPLTWSWEVHQALHITCAGLVAYPDEPAPEGWVLKPEVAAAMPTISDDGRTYTFRIRPGFAFSPPSDEEVTAETFRATLERAVSPVFDDEDPGPLFYADIVGVDEYRAGEADHVSGLVVEGDELSITLEAPSHDFLHRLALPYACPVPVGSPALRSGLNPEPPVSGAGPYYLAQKIQRRLVVFLKNPNYDGDRPRPFDAIAVKMNTEPARAIDQVQRGLLDAAILPGDNPVSGPGSTVAAEWGPTSSNAAEGDQRWFGAPRLGVDYLALNTTRPAFADPDVRRAVALALDRTALSEAWSAAPTATLIVPSVPGSTGVASSVPAPDVETALELMDGRTIEVTMQGAPTAWDCGPCREFEIVLIGQLQAIGVEVTVVRHPEEYPADALDPDSEVDLLPIGTGTDVPDPRALIGGLRDVAWIGADNLAELDRIESLVGEDRIEGAVAIARRLVDEEHLVIPTHYPIFAFLVSERIGCGFVQPAIGAVDLLSLCVEQNGTPASSVGASP